MDHPVWIDVRVYPFPGPPLTGYRVSRANEVRRFSCAFIAKYCAVYADFTGIGNELAKDIECLGIGGNQHFLFARADKLKHFAPFAGRVMPHENRHAGGVAVFDANPWTFGIGKQIRLFGHFTLKYSSGSADQCIVPIKVRLYLIRAYFCHWIESWRFPREWR